MKWYHYVLIAAFLALGVWIFVLISQNNDLKDQNSALVDSLVKNAGLVQLDTNTWMKRAQAVADIENYAIREAGLKKQVEWLLNENKRLTGLVTIKYVVTIDTLKGASDTVYKVIQNGQEVETFQKVFQEKDRYNIGLSWSCVPPVVNLYHLRIYDELSVLPFVDSETNEEEGIIITNINPYVEMEQVTYLYEPRERNPDRISLSVGLGSNNVADLTGLVSAGYGRWRLWGTLNFNKNLQDRKIIPDDWRIGGSYDILR